MRFEVNVDDGANFAALHKAREAWNEAHPDAPAADLPSFVQVLMDNAVSGALNALPQPSTLSAALTKLAALEQENADLRRDVAATTPASPATPG